MLEWKLPFPVEGSSTFVISKNKICILGGRSTNGDINSVFEFTMNTSDKIEDNFGVMHEIGKIK